jgi:hypothetical protein
MFAGVMAPARSGDGSDLNDGGVVHSNEEIACVRALLEAEESAQA